MLPLIQAQSNAGKLRFRIPIRQENEANMKEEEKEERRRVSEVEGNFLQIQMVV